MGFLDRFTKSAEERLHEAIRANDVKGASGALKSGANPKSRDRNGMSPLHHAAGRGRREICVELRKAGAPLGAKDDLGREPIHLAAGFEGVEGARCLDFLLSEGAEVNARDDGGCTALHYAAHTGDPEKTEVLLAKGAVPGVRDNLGTTPLHRAARAARLAYDDGRSEKEAIACMAGLLGAGAKIDERDENGYKAKAHAGEGEGEKFLADWEARVKNKK